MQAIIEIDGSLLNSGINGVMLRNCSMASGETAASQNYIRNFRKNRKIELQTFGKEIVAAFKSRSNDSMYLVVDADTTGYFDIMRKVRDSFIIYNPFKESFKKKRADVNFSHDYAKLNNFDGMDCVLVCAFGVLIAFGEKGYEKEIIDTDEISDGHGITGISFFANRMVATFEGRDDYFYSPPVTPSFDMEKGAGFLYSEYGSDMTLAVRRTGSRLAVFTRKTIEIKDLSQDPEFPFQGYLYQNNYDMGASVGTIRDINGILYFVGEQMDGSRFICSLMDGELRKLTNEAQSKLLAGSFDISGVLHEEGRNFYLVYGTRNFGIDIGNGSLFEIDRDAHGQDLTFLEYFKTDGCIFRACKSGFYSAEPGSDPYVAGKIRLPKHDFGAAANIIKISFIGEFLESSPAIATLTAERGFAQKSEAHGRGFDFFLIGLRKLNDLEFSVNANFRLTKIIIDYQVLKNGNFYGVG